MPIGLPEFVENPENRCPVLLLLDTSGSMEGEPIQELNRGIAAFKEDVLKDTKASLSVEVAIITFGPVRLIQDFATIDHFTPPRLEASGFTPIGEAIDCALDRLEARKKTYKANGIQYYRPAGHWQRSACRRMRQSADSVSLPLACRAQTRIFSHKLPRQNVHL